MLREFNNFSAGQIPADAPVEYPGTVHFAEFVGFELNSRLAMCKTIKCYLWTVAAVAA